MKKGVKPNARQAEFQFLVQEVKSAEKDTSEIIESADAFLVEEFKSEVAVLFKNLESCYREWVREKETEAEQQYEVYSNSKKIVRIIQGQLSKALSQGINSKSCQESKTSCNLKLPTFDLPVFHGDYHNWMSFKELFTTSIDSNSGLTDIQKFQYLKASLKGDAARIVAGFSITSANYQEAWSTLTARYDNKTELSYAQCAKIFDIKMCKTSDSRSLRNLLDTVNDAVRNLRTLGFEVCELSDILLVYFLRLKVDSDIIRQWELSLGGEIPTFKNFAAFLEQQARCLQNASSATFQRTEVKRPRQLSLSTSVKTHSSACTLCNENHKLSECEAFKSMSLKDRYAFVKKNRLCFNCLRGNHCVSTCRFSTNCWSCHERHHTLLHEFKPTSQTKTVSSSEPTKVKEAASALCVSKIEKPNRVLLSTAVVKVKGSRGKHFECRALLDCGSQVSLITEGCRKKLGLEFRKSSRAISGFNDSVCSVSSGQVCLRFAAKSSNQFFHTTALVVDKLSSTVPNFEVPPGLMQAFGKINLADPELFKPAPVEIILGADVFFDLIENERLVIPDLPKAVKTKLGWIISGNVPVDVRNSSVESSYSVSNVIADTEVSELVKRFWEMEQFPGESQEISDDEICEQLYCEGVSRDDTGRYTVSLPFKSNVSLGLSKSVAVKRFLSLEKKMIQNPDFCLKYVNFMREYELLGHMELVPHSEVSILPSDHYYMPHHGVLREQSSTTKLRVVFDASAKTSSGVSLNQFFYSGGRLQDDLFVILCRFRMHAVAMTADIEKMFRQIQIQPEQRDYQRIVWREDPSQELRDYRLTTVTYGTTCAPFLAMRTVQQLARDEESEFPTASRIVLNDFYVDDLLTGSESVEKAKETMKQLIHMCQRGGFQLRKWISSDIRVTDILPDEMKGVPSPHQFDDTIQAKILGIPWDPIQDTFSVQVNSPPPSTEVTKRELLSYTAGIYDPLGFLAPVTVMFKIIIQNLWKENMNWDERIDESILAEWEKVSEELNLLREIRIPRFLLKTKTVKGVELHGFCDASSKAYAAVCYLRTEGEEGQIFVSLICAKTKVAPLKSTTIPRLELCAALLLAQLFKRLCTVLNLNPDESYLWTDSKIVLHWIRSNPLKWKTFVMNRVTKIQCVSQPTQWNHISGQENPADCASRGVAPSRLVDNDLWWQGPPWLRLRDYTEKILSNPKFDSEELELKKSVSSQSTHVDEIPEFVSRFSSFVKLKRVTAWCLRFICNCKSKEKREFGALNSRELERATLAVVKIIQRSEFSGELHSLQGKKPLPRSNKYLSLSPFLDSDGIIRVGGRLKHSSLHWRTKYPMLLPKDHHFTKLVIEYFHLKYLHASPQLVLSTLRELFWIPCGRSVVRKILNRCVTCFRLKAECATPVMGDLPAHRVVPSRPFQRTGVDFAGPILTKPNLKRSKVRIKTYIALFVCFSSKAVHLEVVSELSTSAFLAAFRRFIARRGCPSDMYSDNATNFRGANNYLKNQNLICKSEEVQNFISEESIVWHFIPPQSPHFGGLWESNIKIMKQHLLKTCKSMVLKFEELTTLTAQIEACMNSRPLTQLSTDPNDLAVLTPGHFLIGSNLTEPIESTNLNSYTLLGNWKKVQHLRTLFWNQWKRQYLTGLQNRQKWSHSQGTEIGVGDLVLSKEDTAPLKWILARVIKLFPGSDNVTRVVEIKTARGIFKRSIKSLCRLPVTDHREKMKDA